MNEDTEPQHSEASPPPNRFIRHLWLSATEIRKGGGFYLEQGEYILSAVLRGDGDGLDMLIVMKP